MNPTVSFLITTYDRPELLVQTVAALREAVRDWSRCELVIADDGSAAPTREAIARLRPDVLVRHGARQGLGRNLNHAVAAASGDWHFYLQDDFVLRGPLDDWLAAARAVLESGVADLLRFSPPHDSLRFFPRPPRTVADVLRGLDLREATDGQGGPPFVLARALPGLEGEAWTYSDTPHLRRADFAEKFGPHLEDARMADTEIAMLRRFNAAGGVAAWFKEFETRPPCEHLGAALSNLLEQERLRLRPYLYWISPLDLLDWQLDRDGLLVGALVREPQPRALFAGDQAACRWRLWRPDRWELYDADERLLDAGPNRAGAVPIVPVRFREDGGFLSLGLGQDLEPLQADILNIASCLGEILFRQTFSQLVAEGSAEEYGEDGDLGRIGAASIFLYPEGRKAPQYISADAAQARLLMDRIDQCRDEIYRLANLATPHARRAQVESGVAIALKFVNTNEALADFAANLRDAMQKALVLAGRWQGLALEPGSVRVARPADFGVVSAREEIEVLEILTGAAADPLLLVRQQEKVARALYPQNEALRRHFAARLDQLLRAAPRPTEG